jgi:hypothetical protein
LWRRRDDLQPHAEGLLILLPKKRKAALRGALSMKQKEGKLILLD